MLAQTSLNAMQNCRPIPLLLLLLPLFAACDRKTESPAQPAERASPVQTVATVPLQAIRVFPQLTAQAQVISRNISNIAAQISARIVSLPVEPGQKIVQGAAVAKLDCRDYTIALAQAKAGLEASDARLKLAAQQLKRSEDLASRNFISGDALDSKRTELKINQADRDLAASQLASAQSNVAKCTIAAPFDAIVETKTGNVGELASPGSPLVRLWELNGLEVSAQVQEQDTASLRQAGQIELVTPEGRYPLRLKRISPAMSGISRTQEARFGFIGALPKPGASGQVEWRSNVPHLPADMLVTRNRKLGIFVVEQDRARFQPIDDAQEGRPAPAPQLDAGARIVTTGRYALQDGQQVSVPAASR